MVSGVLFGGSFFFWWIRRRILAYFRSKSLFSIIFSDKIDGDDACSSLFYGSSISSTGEGLPYPNTSITSNDYEKLTTIRKDCVKLSADLYRQVVWYLPVVCVDVILQRTSDRRLLLFWRRDKPASNIWWWPGGRMLKGETFYTAACRKIKEETANETHDIKPITVLRVWNTFFSDSNWDDGRCDDEKGCQTVNIIVICEIDDEKQKFQTSINKEWAVSAHRWITIDEALEAGKYDKYVRLNVEEAVQKGYLQ